MLRESVTELLFELNLESALLLPLVWGPAALGAGRLALRSTPNAVRWRARTGLALLAAGLVLVVVRAAVAVALARHGWSLGADFVLVGTPVVLLPAGAVAALSMPGYWRLSRIRPRPAPDDTAAGMRIPACSPRLVVPVQATAVGAVLGAVVSLHPPVPPYLRDSATALLVVGLAAAALWARHRRRARRLVETGFARPRWYRRLAVGLAAMTVTTLVVSAGVAGIARSSRLPDRFPMAGHDRLDLGGGPGPGAAHAGAPGVHAGPGAHAAPATRSVADLLTPRSGPPDRRFTLTARRQQLRLASGETVSAWAFNGQIPGPELRVRRGELVEVELVNADVDAGVTLHWHGLHVPNGEDGVAGLTQDAVPPGGRYVYRFRADQEGTFWYHSHQQSALQVFRGLFGALVIEPPGGPPPGELDQTVVAHTWDVGGVARSAFGDHTGARHQPVPAGTPVRLRLVNADNCPRTYALRGAPFRVAAIDGVALSGPGELVDTQLRVPGGGRYDLTFRQPAGPVQLSLTGDTNAMFGNAGEGCGEDGAYGGMDGGRQPNRGLALLLGPDRSPDGRPLNPGQPVAVPIGAVLDPAGYGTPAPTPFGRTSRFDRHFDLVFGVSVGFYDGRFGLLWTLNNASFPHTPTWYVRPGDLVKVTLSNRSVDDHPVHLHGHHLLVLGHNGRPATGSPWWTDSLNIAPGERYEVAFRADNPGIWMHHCHNLEHALAGTMMHLMYDGYTTPYEVGRTVGNHPE